MRAVLLVILALAPLAAAQTGLEQTEEAQGPAVEDASPEDGSTLVGHPWAWAVVAGLVLIVGVVVAIAAGVLRSRGA